MNFKNNFNKVKYYFRRYGFFETLKKVLKRLLHIKENRKTNQEQYKIWMEKNTPKAGELEFQRNFNFEYKPKISIVVPMYNTDEKFFKELIESIEKQTYSNWELCLADGSEKQNVEFKKYYEKKEKIKYKFLKSNKGISENTNEAIKLATGDFIGFLDHDDIISPDCLYEITKTINKVKNVDFIYTDEDKIDEQGERFEPYFKPDFSPETLECNNYITHFVVVKKELLKKVGMLNSKFNGAQDFDFVLRATEKANRVVHISKILYHWRVHKSSTANVADSKPYAYEAGIKVIEEHLKRTGKKGIVEYGQDVPGIYKVKFEIKGKPKVSILIPNKDNINLLKNCIDSIINVTSYSNYEIAIIENNSVEKETFEYYEKITQNPKIKLLDYNTNKVYDNFELTNSNENKLNEKINQEINEKTNSKNEFNYSSLINFGVQNVDGDFILQLNNDTKVLTNEWLELFIGYAQNKEIGAIGARLYYEDKTIQHAGIIIGLSGIAGNALVNLPFGKHAYFGRESATRNVLAVTGACLFCRRNLYEEVRIYG